MTGARETIVVAEDDEDLRAAIREILEDEGYAVRAAANGRETLAALLEDPRPSVVVLDLETRSIDGVDIIETIENDDSHAPPATVLISDRKIRPNGVARVLSKPFDLEELLVAVADLSRH